MIRFAVEVNKKRIAATHRRTGGREEEEEEEVVEGVGLGGLATTTTIPNIKEKERSAHFRWCGSFPHFRTERSGKEEREREKEREKSGNDCREWSARRDYWHRIQRDTVRSARGRRWRSWKEEAPDAEQHSGATAAEWAAPGAR